MRRKIFRNNKHIQKNEKEQTNKMKNEQQQLEFGKKMLREWTKTQNLGKTFLVEKNELNKMME